MTTTNIYTKPPDSSQASGKAALQCSGKRPGYVRPTYDIGTIFRENKDKLTSLSKLQRKVLNAISICRTEKLGGHRLHCDNCGYEEISYNSCRNRHCPKCQYFKKIKWLNDRAEEILPVKYFHIVFTIPDILNPLVLQNKVDIYNILFRAAGETLNEAAKNPDNLGACIGFIAVLHTWGQNLMDHPHLHCVVSGGGLSADKTKWISCRDNFFMSVKRLRKLFRGKFLAYLKKAYTDNRIQFHGKLQQLRVKHNFMDLLKQCYAKTWMVYAKKPFASPAGVFKYLGRYTHRVAISNSRITGYTGAEVSFHWKDYRNKNQIKVMTLKSEEFIRRFLLHVLPSGFKRIRFYGLLSNRYKKENLKLARKLLGYANDCDNAGSQNPSDPVNCKTESKEWCCPRCQSKNIRITEIPAGSRLVKANSS